MRTFSFLILFLSLSLGVCAQKRDYYKNLNKYEKRLIRRNPQIRDHIGGFFYVPVMVLDESKMGEIDFSSETDILNNIYTVPGRGILPIEYHKVMLYDKNGQIFAHASMEFKPYYLYEIFSDTELQEDYQQRINVYEEENMDSVFVMATKNRITGSLDVIFQYFIYIRDGRLYYIDFYNNTLKEWKEFINQPEYELFIKPKLK